MPVYIVDTFAERLFPGGPTAVCVLEEHDIEGRVTPVADASGCRH